MSKSDEKVNKQSKQPELETQEREQPEYLKKFGHKKRLKQISVEPISLNTEKEEEEKKEISKTESGLARFFEGARSEKRRRSLLSPARIIALGMLIVIFLGAFILSLPISNSDGNWRGFNSSFFSSVSVVCVTGLGMEAGLTSFSIFGQVVILFLIQLGGLGFMAMATMLFLLIRKRITLSDRLAMQEALNHNESGGIVRLMRNVIVFTFLIEGAGMIILLPFFIIESGAIGIFQAIFLTVSAFCNAGLTIIPAYTSEVVSSGAFSNIAIMLTISALTLIGGLGFTVLNDTFKQKGLRNLSTHSKLVLLTSFIVTTVSVILFFAFEYNNTATMGGKGFFEKLVMAILHSTSVRTSGFYAFDIGHMTPASTLLSIVLMLIGASPASTGGGIKTTTIAILVLVAIAGFRNSEEVTFRKRTITRQTVLKAATILFFALSFITTVSLGLLLTEINNAGIYENPDIVDPLYALVFEAFGAFSTSGLSLGATSLLTTGGKYIVCAAMFMGRVGPLTIGLTFIKKHSPTMKYLDSNIMVG